MGGLHKIGRFRAILPAMLISEAKTWKKEGLQNLFNLLFSNSSLSVFVFKIKKAQNFVALV